MIANVGNADANARLYESLDNTAPNIASKKAGSAAPGVSGASTSGVGTAPPAAPVTSQSLTVSLAPGSPVPPDPATLRASSDRFAVAASGGPTAADSSIALTPLGGMRALFKAALEANENQQDAALERRQAAMEVARGKLLAAADENMKAADGSSRGLTLALSCAAAGAEVFGTKWNSAYLVGAGKGLDAGAAWTTSDEKADAKVSDAIVSLHEAAATEAKSKDADANDLSARLRQQWDLMARALQEIGDSQAKIVA